MQKRTSAIAAIFAILSATSATAQEFIVTLDAPLEGVSDALYPSLKVSPLDAFEVKGVHYVVLDAPNEVRVETLFSAYGTWPIAMSVVDGNWTDISELSSEKKLLNTTPVFCRFCLG